MGASSSVAGENSPTDTRPRNGRRFWPRRSAPFTRSVDCSAGQESTPPSQPPAPPENAGAAPQDRLESLDSRELAGQRQLTGKVAAPASAMSLSPTRLSRRTDTTPAPTVSDGLVKSAMPRFKATSPNAQAADNAQASAIGTTPQLNSGKLTSMSQGGMSGSKLLGGTMKDVPFSTNSAAAAPQSTRRNPVVSFGAAGKTGNGTGPQVKVINVTPSATPAVASLAVVTTTADGARHIFQKLPGYPGYAESIEVLEAAARKKRHDEKKRERDARANRIRVENEASVSLLGSSSVENREYAQKVAKQVAQASHDLDAYTASIRALLRCWELASEQYENIVCDMGEVMVAQYPQYAQLFSTSSQNAQARVMIDMLGDALVIIARPNEMFDKLLEMGAMHRRYNVGEEYFLALKSAFTAVLPKYLPADMRGGFLTASSSFWNIVIPLLVHGLASARGDWHALQHKEAYLAEARRIMGEIMARKTSSERGTFMLEMLECAVELDASMERFALLRERRTAIRAFTGIVRVLEGSTDLAATQLLMEDLAFRHSVFGLDAAAMRGFRQPFIETCHYSMWKKKCLELFKLETPQSLGEFWDYVTDSWDAAMKSNAKARMAQAERAPDGSEPFCLMFTDIEGSTRLWERSAAVMADAVEAHHRIVRGVIADYGAYEVKTAGESFVIAAKDVLVALRIAVTVQLELMRGPIANGFEMLPNPQGVGPPDCWRRDSLRVRVGIHLCRDASAVYDSVQRRYDYYGSSVNCTARVESAACGGQILISEDALEVLQDMPEFSSAVAGAAAALKADQASRGADRRGSASSLNDAQEHLNGSRPLSELIVMRDWGEHIFKGIAKDVQVYSMLPKPLAERLFPLPERSIGSSAAYSRTESVPASQVGSVVAHTRSINARFTVNNDDDDFGAVIDF